MKKLSLLLNLKCQFLFAAALQSTSQLHFCGNDDIGTIMEDDQVMYANYSTLVIVPEMRLDFSGHITGWSARTLVKTESNFLDVLNHAITFQVWRPSSPVNPMGYTLVGSNELTFEGSEIRPGLTEIPNTKTTSYFNFTNKEVPLAEQIRFISGDIIGWYVSRDERIVTIPLTVLYRARNPGTSCTIHEYRQNTTEKICSLCNSQSVTSLSSATPYVSISYGEHLHAKKFDLHIILCFSCSC